MIFGFAGSPDEAFLEACTLRNDMTTSPIGKVICT